MDGSHDSREGLPIGHCVFVRRLAADLGAEAECVRRKAKRVGFVRGNGYDFRIDVRPL